MGDKSKIEWTDATWNPVTGCSKVSRGCRNCYAEREWPRLAGNVGTVYHGRRFNDVQCHPERLDIPIRWHRPRKIFVNSMSDLFHDSVPDEFITQVFEVMSHERAGHHVFQILTKRPLRMQAFLEHQSYALENIWFGVSCEDQKTADERIPILLTTKARIRWVSLEPLLGPIELTRVAEEGASFVNALAGHSDIDGRGRVGISEIDWVVVGGESGPKARPMHPDWVRSLRDQCLSTNTPFNFKQWGEWKHGFDIELFTSHGAMTAKSQIKLDGLPMIRVGTKFAGRILDGREWNEYPTIQNGVTS